jgi:hypothetical protein
MTTLLTPKVTSAVNNLVNGNLTDAQNQTKGISYYRLLIEVENLGYCTIEAHFMSSYLKGKISFQDYCDKLENPLLP